MGSKSDSGNCHLKTDIVIILLLVNLLRFHDVVIIFFGKIDDVITKTIKLYYKVIKVKVPMLDSDY